LKKILIFLLLSLLIGAVYIYPDIRFMAELNNDFKGITLTGTADETFYLARLKGIYKGDYKLANVGNYEHRNDIWFIPPYFEFILGSMGKALNISVPYLDIIFSFIFPVIIFWLIYLLAYYLSRSRRLGILGACSILLGYSFFSCSPVILKQIATLQYSQPLWFLRPFSPQLVYIPFILSLILIFLFIDTHRKWRLILISVLIALLNYLHLYLWAFLSAGLGIWLIIALLQKNKLIWKNIAVILILTTLFAIPYWLNYYRVNSSVNNIFFKEVLGMQYSHKPIIPMGYLLVSLMILFCNRKANVKFFNFLLSFLLGGFICLNQQVISGELIQPAHFSNYANKTFIIIAIIVSLGNIKLFKRKEILRIFFIPLAGFLFFLAFIQQNNYYHANKKTYADLQSLSGAISWLKHNTSKEDVIITDSVKFPSFVLIRNLLVYTDNYHYLSFEIASLIPREEKENRIFYAMRFFEYPIEEADSIFNFKGGLIFFGMSAKYGLIKDADRRILDLRNRYINLMDKDPIYLLRKYKIDYVLLTRNDHLFNVVEKKYPNLSEVFNDGNYKIMKFNNL